MDVDCITFTGSTDRQASGAVLGKVEPQSAPLWSAVAKPQHHAGGRAPDLDAAARSAVGAIFYNQGEVCTAASRLLVQSSIKPQFMERLLAHAARWISPTPWIPPPASAPWWTASRWSRC